MEEVLNSFVLSAKGFLPYWLTEQDLSGGRIVLYYLSCLMIFQVLLCVGANVHHALGRRGWVRIWRFPSDLKDHGFVPKEQAFKYDTPFTMYERLKVLVMLLSGLAVLRLVMFVLFMVIGAIFLAVSSKFEKHLFKRFFEQLTVICARIVFFFGGFYVIHRHGDVAPSNKAKVLCCNHIGFMEGVVLVTLHNFPSFVSKKENIGIPFFPGVAKATQAVLVDRADPDSRRKTLEQVTQRARDTSPNAKQLFIFPEGTCSNQLVLLKFSKGAFVPGEPVQPILFRFPYRHFNACFTARELGGNDMGDVIFFSMCQFVNYIEYKCMDVYTPSAEEKANPELFASNVEQVMARGLGIPRTEASFADFKVAISVPKKQQTKERPETFFWKYYPSYLKFSRPAKKQPAYVNSYTRLQEPHDLEASTHSGDMSSSCRQAVAPQSIANIPVAATA